MADKLRNGRRPKPDAASDEDCRRTCDRCAHGRSCKRLRREFEPPVPEATRAVWKVLKQHHALRDRGQAKFANEWPEHPPRPAGTWPRDLRGEIVVRRCHLVLSMALSNPVSERRRVMQRKVTVANAG